MTVFALARLRRTALIALYLSTRPCCEDSRRILPSAVTSTGFMTREQLVTAIAQSGQGKRLLGENGT